MRRHALATALALLLSPAAFAQHAGHVPPHQVEAPATEVPDAEETADPHAGHQMPAPAEEQPDDTEAPGVDHAAMGHDMPTQQVPVDHSQMDHSQMDHSQMDHSQMDHSQMDHSQMEHGVPAQAQPRTPIPSITDADRAAASFAGGHAAHDQGLHSFVLFDRLEATDGDHGRGQAWEMQAWIGRDVDKLWLRSEGERTEGRTESADLELLYGRAISPWWDLVAGIRHDFKPGEARSHAALGVIGMSPYKFEVEATAYLSGSGDLSARFEAEYDTLLTNRLILQWLAEAELHGEDDPARGIGSGLSTVEAGLRLRYEIRREFAPYLGIVRERAFGSTAGLRREHGDPVDDTLLVAGVRIWF